jgi:hypothetical protein
MKRKTKRLSTESNIRKKTGPKTLHNERMDKIAYNQARKGKSNKEIYEILGITEQCGIIWKRKYKSFYDAIKNGRNELRNDLVEKSLLDLALGFEHSTQKAIAVSDGKDMGQHIEKVRVKEYHPPQIKAITFLLTNRKAVKDYPEDGWADKQSVEHSGTLNYKVTPDDELEPEDK